MQVKIKAKCERVRRNNGIIEVFLTKRMDLSAGKSQEEHALFNLVRDPKDFEEGREYWITIDPAFPH